MLCGPDKASLRVGIRLGFKDGLVALEELLGDVGYKPKAALRLPYTRKWHTDTLIQLAMLEKKKP